jgi:signal transduction histidine kinase
MNVPSFAALVGAGALIAAAAGAAAWWTLAFRRLLPLERALRAKQAELEAARALAGRLFDANSFSQRPAQALAEAAGRALDELQRLHPGLAFAAAARAPDGRALLLAHRGGAWARAPLTALRFDQGLLARAAADGEASWELERSGAAAGDLLAEALADLGYTAAEARGWTGEDGAGALVAAQCAPGPELADAREDVAMAAAALRAAAALAERLARLFETRERLQGGLTAAMEELTHTHDRLIRKSKEVRTLHDVAMALVNRAERGGALAAVGAIVARAIEADLVAFLTVDEATGELATQPGAYGLDEEEMYYRLPMSDDRASSVRVFKTRVPFVSGDAQNDPGTIQRYVRLWRVHSLMVVPLIVEDRVLGVMRVGSRRRNAFTAEALQLVTVVAEEAAILVETAILNRRLSETTEQLAALNRMKDEFVSTVSHEFKTPLTTITGFLSVMLDGETGPLTQQQMKFLQIAKAAAKRLAGLVSDLLDLSRLEGGAKMELRPLDLVELVSQSIDNHQPAAAEGGKTLVWNRPPRALSVLGDPRWLGLVVDNLVSNAVKFTRPAGRIAVDAREKGEFLMISVTDDGIGIPEADREKLFERFYRASNRGEVNAPGTGLGLAIAREVVSKHGGKIWFESEVGRGTTFHFVVPTAREEASAL